MVRARRGYNNRGDVFAGQNAVAVVLALCMMTLTGCTTIRSLEFNLLSTEEEIRLGRQLSAEVEKQERVLDDKEMQTYVRQLGAELAQYAPRQDVEYTFKVIDAPDKVNAFALPGGYIYVYTGLMRICENEAELAAVMAHEIGHVSGYHHGESISRQYSYNLVMSIILGEDANALAELGARIMGTAGHMFYSRENEREADRTGMNILVQAGYNPGAMLSFMGKLIEEDQRRGGGRGLPIFASHPPTEERIELLDALYMQYPQNVRDSAPYREERYRRKVLDVLE